MGFTRLVCAFKYKYDRCWHDTICWFFFFKELLFSKPHQKVAQKAGTTLLSQCVKSRPNCMAAKIDKRPCKIICWPLIEKGREGRREGEHKGGGKQQGVLVLIQEE